MISFKHLLTYQLLPLDGDPLPECPPVHAVEALAALHGERLLHRLVQLEHLLLRPTLQVQQPRVKTLVAVVDGLRPES